MSSNVAENRTFRKRKKKKKKTDTKKQKKNKKKLVIILLEAIQLMLNLPLLNTTCPVLANSIDPYQMASEEANCSGSALFVI